MARPLLSEVKCYDLCLACIFIQIYVDISKKRDLLDIFEIEYCYFFPPIILYNQFKASEL